MSILEFVDNKKKIKYHQAHSVNGQSYYCINHLIKGDHPVKMFIFGRRLISKVQPASVGALVEVIQHGGVGPLKQPLLAKGGGVACVHEDPPLAWAAVDAAVTDRVIQTLILEDTE